MAREQDWKPVKVPNYHKEYNRYKTDNIMNSIWIVTGDAFLASSRVQWSQMQVQGLPAQANHHWQRDPTTRNGKLLSYPGSAFWNEHTGTGSQRWTHSTCAKGSSSVSNVRLTGSAVLLRPNRVLASCSPDSRCNSGSEENNRTLTGHRFDVAK